MQYQPFLPEVASGTIDPRAVVVPLRPVLKHATVEVGEVTAIDHEERRVRVRIPDGATVSLGYDVLVDDGGFLVAGPADPRPGGARDRVQDGAGGHLPAQPRALPAGCRVPDRGRAAAALGAHVRVRRRRIRRGGGVGRARGPGS